jgi:hypothetical protein
MIPHRTQNNRIRKSWWQNILSLSSGFLLLFVGLCLFFLFFSFFCGGEGKVSLCYPGWSPNPGLKQSSYRHQIQLLVHVLNSYNPALLTDGMRNLSLGNINNFRRAVIITASVSVSLTMGQALFEALTALICPVKIEPPVFLSYRWGTWILRG